MGAELWKTEEEMQVELSPHVIIFANNIESYGKFSELLSANGFPSQIFAQPSEDIMASPRLGTVFFVSFNLESIDVPALVKRIEQKLHMACIVFAENEDFQTAAMLSSAKMNQTLQYPYTQKNFLMAMQTLVRKRKEKFEKELRQRQHHERQKAAKISDPEERGQGPRFFKNEAQDQDSGIIIQEGLDSHSRKSTLIHGDVAPTIASIMQKGEKGSSFFIIQKGDASNLTPKREPAKSGAYSKKVHDELSLEYGPLKEEPAYPSQNASALRLATEAEQSEVAENEFKRNRQYQSLREELMKEYWAILLLVAVGTAVCGYCLYLTLFAL